MAFCAKCGAQLADGATFCPSCGGAQGGGGAATASTSSGLDENVAGLLCYVLGWITGIVFFVIDKRPFVKFHAAQAMVTFGGLQVIQILMAFIVGGSMFMGGLGIGALAGLLYAALGLACFVAWILCMFKAFQHERFKLPFIGDIAENIAGK
ncbi:MAG TPA: zinc-ribbon domain-containing protein [Candidatus Acidoferrales bacterium]|nr:zinc-ribbon domain-containing protein [Candidatus Acidoferrales bacterium]